MESKINYLRENYKSTKNYIVTWEHSYIPKEEMKNYYQNCRNQKISSEIHIEECGSKKKIYYLNK